MLRPGPVERLPAGGSPVLQLQEVHPALTQLALRASGLLAAQERGDLLLGQTGLDAGAAKTLAERLGALCVECRLRAHRATSLHPEIG